MKKYSHYAVETDKTFERYDTLAEARLEMSRLMYQEHTPCILFGVDKYTNMCEEINRYYGERPKFDTIAKTTLVNAWNEITCNIINQNPEGYNKELVKTLDQAFKFLGVIM